MCHRIWNVNFLLKYGGYSHVHILYEPTSCHELWRLLNMEATATFMFYMNRLLAMSMTVVAMMIAFFPNRLDPLDRILSILLDGLTWGAISTTPRVTALRVVSTSCHEHDSHCDDDRFLPNRLDPLDQILSNLLDGRTWGAILTMPRVIALGVVLTSCHRHDSRCDDDRIFFITG
jgi:hypothetical protein